MYKGELHKRNCFLTSYLGSFRGVGIYKTELPERISQRRLMKCLRELKKLKISFVAATDGLFPVSLLSRFSLTAADAARAKEGRIADMALLFARKHNAPLSFFIQGGSFFSVTDIALTLLAETSFVAVSCADSEAVCEAVCEACGAVIKNSPRRASVEIFPATPEALLKFGDATAGFSDFSFSLPSDFPFDIPRSLHCSLVSVLETCGVLEDGEAEIQIS